MSADDDIERALWNNDFYSSPAVLTELSLSSHITTLRQSANLPGSALLLLLSGHLAARLSPAAGPAPENGPARPASRTSLMTVSPSMKALEMALNAAPRPAGLPEVIREEAAEDDAEDDAEGPAANRPSSGDAADGSPLALAALAALSLLAALASLEYASASALQHEAPRDHAGPAGAPRPHTPRTLAASSSCPALSDRHHDVSGAPETGKQPLGPAFQQPRLAAKQAPVRSLLDSPFVASSKPASVFASPRPAAAAHSSPRKSLSAASIALAASLQGQRKDKPVNPKRFSFRGLFKIKSKNHSLSKLKDVDEELLHGSRPVKLSSKSVSTPDMSALVKEQKASKQKKLGSRLDGRKRFFGTKSSSGTLGKDSGALGTDSPRISGKKPLPPKPVGHAGPLEATSVKASETDRVASPLLPPGHETPAAASSIFSVETPLTAYLEPKRGTIREVDDSDYLPNLTEGLPTPSEGSMNHAVAQKLLADDERSQGAHEEASPFISHTSILNAPPETSSPSQFGSPFQVAFDSDGDDPPARLSAAARDQPALSPGRSMTSKRSNEQLAGEALFPKYLDAHEVESIVSLERSRSMRSAKSNKRSSFLNYNGSDENIILGKHLGNLSQGSMRRSGSILKNSPSMQSLMPDVFHLIETAFEDYTPEDATEAVEIDLRASPANDEDYSDLIEFSDFIDFDNLGFSDSPLPVPLEAYLSGLSPSLGVYMEYGNGAKSAPLITTESEPNDPVAPDSANENGDTNDHVGSTNATENTPAVHITSVDETTSAVDTTTAIDTTSSFNDSEIPKAGADSPPALIEKDKSPEIICVSSHTDLDFDTSRVPSEKHEVDTVNISPDPAPNETPLNGTFKFAMEDSRRADGPNQAPRPVSMSFRGFSGSAFKDRILPQSGSHQLIQFDEDSADEHSAVGQGFGSSDEESEDGMDSFEAQEDEKMFHSVSDTRRSDHEPKKMNSFDRRQRHIRNVLDLQPPPSTLPFHHNRIPSISDQSSISSPKLLTSFISRIRNSPLSLPKLNPSRPTVKFSSRIILYDTYHHDEYDRHPEIATCNQLTPLLAQQIKEELNELKSNMEVHEESICYTQFF